jgi:cell division septation protein DedD
VTQTHDTADDGFHEIQLSGKQLVFLFMATTVVSVVIFLCGVLVGRGVRTGSELTQPVENQANATPEEPAATPQDGAAATATPPPPVSEELSYPDRLQQATPKEQLKTSTPPAPEQIAPRPAQPVAEAPAAKPPARVESDVPASGRPGTWVIQVHALRNRDAASSIVKGLIAKGYPAFLPNPPKGEPAIYRVQIGRYKDRAEADQVAQRLAKEEQLRPEVKR